MLRVLLIEDNPGDARLIREIFAESAAGLFEVRCASRLSEGLSMACEADVVLLDLSLPDSHGYETFARVRESAPDKAVVMLTGNDDERLAVEMLRAGAQDYLVKGRVDSQILSRAIRYALERKQADTERERLIEELQTALAEVRRLQAMLPICSYCKSIRKDGNLWQQIESYITENTGTMFNHSICPSCYDLEVKPHLQRFQSR